MGSPSAKVGGTEQPLPSTELPLPYTPYPSHLNPSLLLQPSGHQASFVDAKHLTTRLHPPEAPFGILAAN